jgi:alkaline phosphatase
MAAKSLPFVGLYAPIENKPALDRGDLCRNAANKAISLLNNKKGFFLMIEGSCIDDYCHAHKIGYAMEELFDFDRTVGDVLKWAEKDGETLVIITADHSTGGLTLLDGDLKTGEIKVNFSTGGHNGIITPVFVYGPHAEDFNGIYENAELGQKIRKLLAK